MFLHSFESMLIKTLIDRNKKQPLLKTDDILKVAFRFYDKHLFEHSLAQGLEDATGPSSVTYGYRVGNPDENMQAKQELRNLLDLYKQKEYKQTPLLDNFD